MKKCFTCRAPKKNTGYLQCSKCRTKKAPLGSPTVIGGGQQFISRHIRKNDIADNEIVVNSKDGDPMYVVQTDTKVPDKYRSVNSD